MQRFTYLLMVVMVGDGGDGGGCRVMVSAQALE